MIEIDIVASLAVCKIGYDYLWCYIKLMILIMHVENKTVYFTSVLNISRYIITSRYDNVTLSPLVLTGPQAD